jgi:SAM-dependent methyltransferase
VKQMTNLGMEQGLAQGTCRFCGSKMEHVFVDLGMSPLCESILTRDQLNQAEQFYPLKVFVCGSCLLVQLEQFVSTSTIFSEYAYFSSYSTSWLQHAQRYVEMMVERFDLGPHTSVVELGSNDGYLLKFFSGKGIPVLGVDPARNVAAVAIQNGIPTETGFFGAAMARDLLDKGKRADVIVGNNVLAQVPDINDFVSGISLLLSEQGVLTMEFPHLAKLAQGNQFDTIYHEHFSYFSLLAAEKIFAAHDIRLFDVEELTTHGGSLRIYGEHAQRGKRPVTDRVNALKDHEMRSGYGSVEGYKDFGRKVEETKRKLLSLLIELKGKGKRIAGYGAPGKGNTLLNYCGIRSDFLDFTVDRNPYKHGKFTPGTHICILPPETIRVEKPDYLLILPWNLKEEIIQQMAYIREWGGAFIVPIPEPEIVSAF